MIRVLFVESSATGGGSAESLYQHLRAVDRSRIQPVVVCLNDISLVQRLQDLRVPVYVLTDWLLSRQSPRLAHTAAAKLRGLALRFNRILPASYLRTARLTHWSLTNALTQIVRNEGIDVIHLNVQIYRDIFGLFLVDRTGVPCISHLRSRDPRRNGEFNFRMAAEANNRVAAFIANSRMTAEYWWEHGIDAANTRIVYNGVPSRVGPPVDVRRTWNINGRASFVVGCVASLRNRLKIDEFVIRGFARFLRVHPEAVLLVVGDGPMKETLELESRAMGISDNVRFTGFQQDVAGILQAVDVSIEMATFDSGSRVALETMQAQTPLVATDVGSIREFVRHEENGLLIRHGDDEAFSRSLERLARDNQLRAKLVENGYRTVTERFSIEHYASQMEDTYMSVLGKTRATVSPTARRR